MAARNQGKDNMNSGEKNGGREVVNKQYYCKVLVVSGYVGHFLSLRCANLLSFHSSIMAKKSMIKNK